MYIPSKPDPHAGADYVPSGPSHAGGPPPRVPNPLTPPGLVGLQNAQEATTEASAGTHHATAPAPKLHQTAVEFPRIYHKGVASVPKTGVAIVEKGEQIVPAGRNPLNPENKSKSKVGLFDKVEKVVEQAPHISARKAKSGGWVITVSGDANEDLNGEHIISQKEWDDLCAAYQREPQDFKADAWKKVFADARDAEAQVNPTDSADKVRSASPADLVNHAERATVPFPKVAVKSA